MKGIHQNRQYPKGKKGTLSYLSVGNSGKSVLSENTIGVDIDRGNGETVLFFCRRCDQDALAACPAFGFGRIPSIAQSGAHA